jgi:hypothetical protein
VDACETSRRTLGAVGRGRLLELNCISLGKPKLNTQEGAAKLPVTVPGAGEWR